MLKRGVIGTHLGARQQRRDIARPESIAELLFEQVADHALGFRAEYVERIERPAGFGCLAREQAHLRPVTVRDDERVVGGQCRERARGAPHVVTLGFERGRFAALEEGIAAECCDDSHAHILGRPRVAISL